MLAFQGCEKEVKESSDGDSEEKKKESIMRFSWALVHSRQAEDIQRGIAMLEGILIYIKCLCFYLMHRQTLLCV